MAMSEVFRYSWIKVSDEQGRVAMTRAALDVQKMLRERAPRCEPGSDEARWVRTQQVMARAYLAGQLEHGIRVVLFSPAQGGSLSLDLLAREPHAASRDGIEIDIATMPSGYTRDDALAWLTTPVGAAWSSQALACRLVHAVVNVESPATPPRSEARTEHA